MRNYANDHADEELTVDTIGKSLATSRDPGTCGAASGVPCLDRRYMECFSDARLTIKCEDDEKKVKQIMEGGDFSQHSRRAVEDAIYKKRKGSAVKRCTKHGAIMVHLILWQNLKWVFEGEQERIGR